MLFQVPEALRLALRQVLPGAELAVQTLPGKSALRLDVILVAEVL